MWVTDLDSMNPCNFTITHTLFGQKEHVTCFVMCRYKITPDSQDLSPWYCPVSLSKKHAEPWKKPSVKRQGAINFDHQVRDGFPQRKQMNLLNCWCSPGGISFCDLELPRMCQSKHEYAIQCLYWTHRNINSNSNKHVVPCRHIYKTKSILFYGIAYAQHVHFSLAGSILPRDLVKQMVTNTDRLQTNGSSPLQTHPKTTFQWMAWPCIAPWPPWITMFRIPNRWCRPLLEVCP